MIYEIIIYSIWVIVCGVLFLIAYKVLKRNPHSRINQLFACSVLTAIIGVVFDLIKNPMVEPSQIPLATLLNVFSLYFTCFSLSFMVLVLFMLSYPETMNKFKYQCAFILIYGGVLAIMFFIPDGITLERQDGSTLLVSVYNLSLTIFTISFILTGIGITIYLYKKLYKSFKNPIVTKKFRFFVIGICILFYSPIGTCIVNYLNILVIRTIFSYTLMVLFVGLLFVYYGIGANFKSD